jgi:hypothetical protein
MQRSTLLIWMFRRVVVAALVLLVLVVWVPQEAHGLPTMSVNPASQFVDVSPGSTGTALFSGEVTFAPHPTTITGTLNVSTTLGDVTVSPKNFQLSAGDNTQPFSLIARVPPLTTANTIVIVNISCEYQQGLSSGTLGLVGVQVITLPYQRVAVYSTSPRMNTTRGGTANFDLVVENLGNCEAEYSIILANKDRLDEKGISMEPNVKKVLLEEKMNGDAIIKIKTSDDTPIGNHMVKLNVTWQGEDYFEYTLYVNVQSKGSQVFEAVTNPIIIGPAIVIMLVAVLLLMKRRKNS